MELWVFDPVIQNCAGASYTSAIAIRWLLDYHHATLDDYGSSFRPTYISTSDLSTIYRHARRASCWLVEMMCFAIPARMRLDCG